MSRYSARKPDVEYWVEVLDADGTWQPMSFHKDKQEALAAAEGEVGRYPAAAVFEVVRFVVREFQATPGSPTTQGTPKTP